MVERSREKIEVEELAVFREVGNECEAMMVGHAQFPAWGKNAGPASLNRDIVTGLLRESMGYRGLVMTDDLEMGAIANRYGSAEASRQAVRAGEEILLICHNPACAEIARDALAEMPEKEWRPAVEKVAAFSAKLKEPAGRFDLEKWKQTNQEIADFRKAVAGGR